MCHASDIRQAGRALSALAPPLPPAALAVVLAGSAGVGAALLVHVYHAATSAPPDYELFWVGMALIFVPAWLVALSRRWPGTVAVGAIVLTGLAAYFPAYLRAPNRPVFGDALAHYLSVVTTLRTGNPFAGNPVVPVAASYPGLHTLTAALVKLTGAPIWDVAVVLLALFHVATLLGVYSIAMALSRSPHAAAAAAVVYSVSPQFGFFDSQFAYESLAVPLLVWTLALVLHAGGDRRRRSRHLLTAAAGLGACCVITHHLTSYMLAAVLIVTGGVQLLTNEHDAARRALGVGIGVAAFAVVWVVVTGAPIISYLGYFPRTAFDAIGPIFRQILGLRRHGIGGTLGAPATRSLFTGSTLPVYERYAAYGVQVIAFAATLVAAWRLRRRRSGPLVTLALLAATYFLLLPLRLNLAGEQGANRVSTFQWIGIAVVVAIGLTAGPQRGTNNHHVHQKVPLARRALAWLGRGRPLIAAAILVFSLVGTYGSAVSASSVSRGPLSWTPPMAAIHPSRRSTLPRTSCRARPRGCEWRPIAPQSEYSKHTLSPKTSVPFPNGHFSFRSTARGS